MDPPSVGCQLGLEYLNLNNSNPLVFVIPRTVKKERLNLENSKQLLLIISFTREINFCEAQCAVQSRINRKFWQTFED